MSVDPDIRFSKPGYGVDDGDQHLVYNSDYPLMRIAQKGCGSFSFGVADTSKSATYTHNLGYRPMVYVFCQGFHYDTSLSPPDDLYLLPRVQALILQNQCFYGYTLDDSTLVISVSMWAPPLAAATLEYWYMLFYNPIYEDESKDLGVTGVLDQWGAKFSKENTDATVALQKDLTFSSGKESLQVHKTGIDDTGTASHNLGKSILYDNYYYDGSDVYRAGSLASDSSSIAVDTGGVKGFYTIFREGGCP